MVFLVFTSFGCRKDDNPYSLIPDVRVNESLLLNQPQYFPLGVVGGWMYVNGGSKGIIVYRYSIDEFRAYERHSPYRSDETCSKVDVDSLDLIAVERCDSSKFVLSDGSVLEGPAEVPLKQYQTILEGQVLRITN